MVRENVARNRTIRPTTPRGSSGTGLTTCSTVRNWTSPTKSLPDVGYDGPQSLGPHDVTGPEDVKSYVETYRTVFPDLWYTVEDVTRADGEVRVR